ncbi:hypothetical protein EBESD8_2640 [Rhodococcus aetherivorans]|nr:hypothetical protein EBESD8_2640 [Rhodococcus aetherivorans]
MIRHPVGLPDVVLPQRFSRLARRRVDALIIVGDLPVGDP